MATLEDRSDMPVDAFSGHAKSDTAQQADPSSLGSISLAWAMKRLVDVVVAAVLLVVLLPLFVTVIVAIVLESPGTPFYRARRAGYRGRSLDVLKFRKMAVHAGGAPLTVAGDPRLTRVGALMTRTRIDELPQLWNVLTGSMSLVGPRPEDPRFVDLHASDYERILQVRPGITGWSQLAFAAESTILDQADPVAHYVATILPAKVRIDCKYAERPRVRQDFAVMLWTAAAMLGGTEVAVHRETGHLGRRRRPQGARIDIPRAPARAVDIEPAAESLAA